MSATLLGTTGSWGIPLAETGLIIDKLDFDFKLESKKVKNLSGGTQGLSLYDETCDVDLAGDQSATSPLMPRLAATLALANSMPDLYRATVTGGRLVVMNPKVSLAVEDFVKLDVKATHFPLISATGSGTITTY